jgi:hypothetical protein
LGALFLLAEGLSFAELRNRAPAAPVAPVELRPLVLGERELAFAA